MSTLRIILILLNITAIQFLSSGGVSDIESIGITINCMIVGITVATWRA